MVEHSGLDHQIDDRFEVTFDDKSVGWYEAGWGPMMSETAFFVKDVIGPKGSVSIVLARGVRHALAEQARIGVDAVGCLALHECCRSRRGRSRVQRRSRR